MTPAKQIDKFKVVDNPGSKSQTNADSFESRLLGEVRKYYNLTKSSRSRRYYIQTIADLFSKGLHWVKYDNRSAVFTEWAQADIDKCLYTPVPRLQYAVEVIAAQYTSSNARPVAVSPATDIKSKAVVRQLQDYAEYLDWEFYRADPDQRQTEAKLIPLRGVYNLLEYDFSQGAEYKIPQYQGQESPVCMQCGVQADNEQAVCQQCGGQIKPMMLGLSQAGVQTARQGKVVRKIYDALQVEIYDRRRDIDESPYLIADEIVFKSEINKWYPHVVEVSGQACLGNWNEGFVGLHYLHQLQTLIANTGGLDQSKTDYVTGYGGAYLNALLVWRRRVWLDVDCYRDWKLEKDTQFPGTNKLIPAGTMVADIFPDGLCLHQINNSQIVKLENVNKNSVWSMVKYRVASTGLHGTGVSSLVSQNRQLDEATSFQMQGLLMAALGITIVDERVKEVPNIPGRAYTLPLDARAPNEPITNLAARIDTGGTAAIAAAEPIKQSITASMSDLSMASAPAASNLIPSTDRTATATRVQAGAVNTLTAPPLELYAANRAKVIGQAIELEKKFNLRPRFYGKFDETAGRWFDPMKIPDDIRFVSAEGSWQPSTNETKREDVSLGFAWGVGTGQNPAMEDQASKVLGFDLGNSNFEDWEIKAEKRLDAMKAALPMLMQQAQQMTAQAEMLDPAAAEMASSLVEQAAPMQLIQMAQAMPRPMDNHQAFQKFYEDFYITDDFDNSPPVLQQAIETLWDLHQNAMAMRAMQETQRAMAVQAPAQEMAQEQGDKEHEKAESSQEKMREHEEASNQSAHQRNLELEDKKHENAKEIEAIRAKAKSNQPKNRSKKRR